MHAWLGESIWPRPTAPAPPIPCNDFDPARETSLEDVIQASAEAAKAAPTDEQGHAGLPVDERSLVLNMRSAIECKSRIREVLESCKSEAEVKKINDQKKLEAELEAAAELERKQEDMAARQS